MNGLFAKPTEIFANRPPLSNARIAKTVSVGYARRKMPSTPAQPKITVPRDDKGRFLPKDEPPLVAFSIANPVTYLRHFWERVIAKEGVDIHFRIHPLTAFALAGILSLGGFGLGRISLPVPQPIVKYLPQFAPPQSTPDPWREAAFSGLVRKSEQSKKFYLETADAEAILLEVPTNVNLTKYIGRRIFATGRLNTASGVLVVTETTDLELLPQQVVHVPTVPMTSAVPSPIVTASPISTPLSYPDASEIPTL